MGPGALRWSALIASLVTAGLLVLSPAAESGRPRGPTAVAACAPSGCTESQNATVPGPGNAIGTTDQIPADATQGSIDVQPHCAAPVARDRAHIACNQTDATDFDETTAAVVDSIPKIAKLSKKSQRILTCVFLSIFSGQSYSNEYGTTIDYSGSRAATWQAVFLQGCLQLALALNKLSPAAADRAHSATAGCSRFTASLVIQVKRVRGGFLATAHAVLTKPSRPAPISVSCKRSGQGFRLSIRPRARHRTLKQVGMTMLGIDYVNPGKRSVRIRTTFRVN
jgi:hypothetical protein